MHGRHLICSDCFEVKLSLNAETGAWLIFLVSNRGVVHSQCLRILAEMLNRQSLEIKADRCVYVLLPSKIILAQSNEKENQ